MRASVKLIGFVAVLAVIFVLAMLAGNAVGPVHSTEPGDDRAPAMTKTGMTTTMQENAR